MCKPRPMPTNRRRGKPDRKPDNSFRSRFIQADTSIAPLDCSQGVFLLVLSFHEVIPQFLDLVFGFGEQPPPASDFHFTAFHHDNTLDQKHAQAFEIPKLGRSGRQIRLCYNLWGVELSDADGTSWVFRQTAMYHSFDVENGQTLWINIKANDLMMERIRDVESTPGRPKPGTDADVCALFADTLAIHLVMFQWCCENWRQFLASLEREIREILTKIKNAPLGDVEKALEVDIDAMLGQSPPSSPLSSSQRAAITLPKMISASSRRSTGSTLHPPSRRVLSGLSAATPLPSVPEGASAAMSPAPASPAPALAPAASGRFGVLKEFSVKTLQRLSGLGTKLQKAELIMRLDATVMGNIAAHYAALAGAADVAAFGEQAAGYVRGLEMEQARIAALMAQLEDGKRLLDTMMQYRAAEINKLFAVSAQDITAEMHASALRVERLTQDMGVIAAKTERETASMHVITLVTLIFLPGTFVAVRFFRRDALAAMLFLTPRDPTQTVFGSGLFQWDQNHPEMPFPMWKQEYFNLFAKICFPMMFGIILFWCVYYAWITWRDQRDRVKDDEEMLVAKDDNEKSGSWL